MTPPPGVILAGGLARRMGGGDKGLLPLAPGVCLIDAVMARLAPQVSAMALNANGDPARFARLGLEVLPDSMDSRPGPLAGVLAGLDWAAARGDDRIVTVAADTPFFPTDLVPRLVGAAATAPTGLALAATPDGRQPTFGLWPVALRDELRAALEQGVRKIVAWTDAHGAAEAGFASDGSDPFFNVNTPDDLDRAQALYAGQGG